MITIFRRIAALWDGHRWLGAALAATLALRTVFTVVLALSIKLIIDRIVEGNVTGSPVGIVLLLVAGYVVSAGAAIAAGHLEARASARILSDVRRTAFEHLQRLSIGFHERSRAGDILARFSTDIAGLAQGAVKKPRQALQSLLAIGLFLPVMAILEWRLALVAAVAMPAAVYLANRAAPAPAPSLDAEKRLLAEMLEEVDENLSAQPVIRAFGLHQRARDRFQARLGQLEDGFVTANFRVLLVSALAEYSVSLVQLVLVGAGAVLALNGDLAAGDFAAFVALLTEFSYQTTVIASDVLPELTRAGSSIRRIDELLTAGPVNDPDTHGRPPPALSDAIEFVDVAFGYSPAEGRLLDGLNLRLPAGSSIAIVGPSGSGKSTLLNLLLRFYDPDAGAVLLDGVDLRDVDAEHYRDSIGVVFQQTFLFGATIRDNIRIAQPHARDPEIEAAARAAGLDEVVAGLPLGLDTPVGSGGRKLSGGQQQRIGIARAILRSPTLLLLDEVTSALDPVTEAAVNETLVKLAGGRTSVLVTHRLQTVAGADLIVVMQDGRPVEQGTFDQLRAGGSVFQSMWDKQSGFAVSPDGRAGEISPARLAAIPLFSEIAPDELAELADRFAADHFVAGEDVFAEGDPADRFHVIARGVVEVMHRDEDGQEEVIAHLEDGDFFGEMALLDDAPRNATIRAVTPTLTLSLDRRQFESLLQTSSHAAELVRQVAAGRASQNQP
ncbi:MAG: ATP-binding cassette domain-containing protein [Acidimicrobiia bacterium]|nr:ATP-binding cassette domain-containing protein [Acidimicrobiia bacterium]